MKNQRAKSTTTNVVNKIWAVCGALIPDPTAYISPTDKEMVFEVCERLGILRQTAYRQMRSYIRFKGNQEAMHAFERGEHARAK